MILLALPEVESEAPPGLEWVVPAAVLALLLVLVLIAWAYMRGGRG